MVIPKPRVIKLENWKPERKHHYYVAKYYRCTHVCITPGANYGEDILKLCCDKGLSGFTPIGRMKKDKRVYGLWP